MRMFELVRDRDVSGVSGIGVVAEGVEFSSGVVALTWLGDWPTSVVFHNRGIESVQAIHGHSGSTRVVFTDGERDEAAIQRVQAACDKPNPGPSWDSYVEGYNDALSVVQAAMEGDADA